MDGDITRPSPNSSQKESDPYTTQHNASARETEENEAKFPAVELTSHHACHRTSRIGSFQKDPFYEKPKRRLRKDREKPPIGPLKKNPMPDQQTPCMPCLVLLRTARTREQPGRAPPRPRAHAANPDPARLPLPSPPRLRTASQAAHQKVQPHRSATPPQQLATRVQCSIREAPRADPIPYRLT